MDFVAICNCLREIKWFQLLKIVMSQNTSADRVNGQPRNRGSIPGNGRRLSFSPKVFRLALWDPSGLLLNQPTWDFSLGVNRSGRVKLTIPSCVKVNYDWSYASAPPYSLTARIYSVYWSSFNFIRTEIMIYNLHKMEADVLSRVQFSLVCVYFGDTKLWQVQIVPWGETERYIHSLNVTSRNFGSLQEG